VAASDPDDLKPRLSQRADYLAAPQPRQFTHVSTAIRWTPTNSGPCPTSF
jgi:hypothetical protein